MNIKQLWFALSHNVTITVNALSVTVQLIISKA